MIVFNVILQIMKLNHVLEVNRSMFPDLSAVLLISITIYQLLPVSSMEGHITIKMKTLTQLVLIAVMQHMLFSPSLHS